LSWQMHAVAAYAALLRRPRSYQSARSAAAFLRKRKGSSEPPTRLPKLRHHRITSARHGTFTCYTVDPPDGTDTESDGRSTIYVHGGGYVSEIQVQHWNLIADVATATRRRVHVPIYGLASDHDALAAHRFLREVLDHAATQGPVYLAGDSAGAGLALAVTQCWLADGGHTPLGLTLISPWLDITLKNPAITDVAARDPWLGIDALRFIGRTWAGPLNYDDPKVSPINGDLTALPPTDLYIGTRDVFLPDCRRLGDHTGESTLDYTEQPGALHVYPLLPVPEGRNARDQLITQIATRLRP
jgi:acetyl esterase/lipase